MSTAAESGRVIFYGAACREDVLASVRFVIKKKKKKRIISPSSSSTKQLMKLLIWESSVYTLKYGEN